MNEWSALSLAVIAQAVEDVGKRNGVRRNAIRFLMDEDDLFFFIDAGQLEIKTGQLRREMRDPKKNKIHVRELRRLMRACF